MKLYSKECIERPVSAMAKSGRFVHSYIITGEKGTGKKVAAKYIAMQLLCENHKACGQCRQCRRVLNGQHPDFITVEKSGRIYTINDVRTKVVDDSYTAPNDCERKVYFLPDCEGWMDAAQDALLKITEDPPDTAYFIFTAVNKNSFLPTLISRSMTLDVPEATRENCAQALRDTGKYTEEQISEAVGSFGGNIGRCMDFLDGDADLKKSADAVKKAVEAMITGDEYSLAVTLNSAASSREEMRSVLEMLSRVVRDAAAARYGSKTFLGCSAGGAMRMSERISSGRLIAMYDAICEASYRCTRNCNAQVAAAVLSGKLCR